MKILVSACLLGENCKYNGKNNYNQSVIEYVENMDVISVCPELLAGLGVPRTPIEIVNNVLMDKSGNNLDSILRSGIRSIINQLNKDDICCAVLQSRSPTCGVNQIYDGSFSGKLINGSGVFAKALEEAGIKVIDAEDIP